MLTLILMRHAEAQLSSDCDDHERRLTPRGVSQAQYAAKLLSGWGIAPDVTLCSDAKRALETVDTMLSTLNVAGSSVRSMPFLYQSYTTQVLVDNLAAVAEEFGSANTDCLLCVGHNPDLSYRADALMSEPLPVAFPTSGVLVLGFDVERWRDVSARSAVVLRSSFL